MEVEDVITASADLHAITLTETIDGKTIQCVQSRTIGTGPLSVVLASIDGNTYVGRRELNPWWLRWWKPWRCIVTRNPK